MLNNHWYRSLRCSLLLIALLAGPVLQGVAQEAPDTVQAVEDTTLAVADTTIQAPREDLQARMQRVFDAISDFQEVDVAVNEGVVRLSGTVPGTEAWENAEALAARFDGVLYVDNQLVEATDVQTRVTPAVRRVQDYWNRIVSGLPAIAVALTVMLFFGMLSRFIFKWERPYERFNISPLVHGLIRRLLSMILFGIGLVLAFDILDVTSLVGAVLGTAGVVGLALGFAFQDIVENYLAGVLLSVRQPFNVNDLVDVGEYQGKVIRLTAREMVMMTVDGNHLRLPNATVFKSPVVNYSRNPLRRFNFSIGIGNEENLAEVMELGVETLKAMKGVLDDPPPIARIDALGDSSVVVNFFGWVDQRQADFGKVRSEALRLVKRAFDDAGYDMPEPIYRVSLSQRPEMPTAKAASAPQPTEPPVAQEAQTIDVSVDNELDEQVREDLAVSDEQNLLSK